MSGHTPFQTLLDRMSPESLARIAEKSDALEQEIALTELRRALNFSQAELAAVLNINQSSVAKMEKRRDMKLGTLRRAIEAMGGELELHARFKDRVVRLDQLGS